MRAHAYIVGPPDGPGEALAEMAQALGFAGVSVFSTLSQAEQQTVSTPICFFLFAATEDVSRLAPIADTIRFSASRRLRFSPLIYFSESPSVDIITSCIDMGFDDVITMPFTSGRVKKRIARQIGRNLVYYETSSYFGPDRRKSITAPGGPAESRIGGQFRRLEIVRNLTSGINVLRDDHFATPVT